MRIHSPFSSLGSRKKGKKKTDVFEHKIGKIDNSDVTGHRRTPIPRGSSSTSHQGLTRHEGCTKVFFTYFEFTLALNKKQ